MLAGLLLVFCCLCCTPTYAKQFHIYVRQQLTQQQDEVLRTVASTNTSQPTEVAKSLWLSNPSISTDQLGATLDQAFVGTDVSGQLHSDRKRSTGSYTPNVVVSEVYAVSLTPVEPNAVQSWGLDRIDQRSLPGSLSYNPDRTGAGVIVWVVDTGVDASHADFGGRATNVYNTYDPPGDCNDHGTHVAGTVAGTTFGVARQALIRAVKVLNCAGSGTTYTVALGLQYVLANRAPNRNVINMSLGYGTRDYVVEALLQDLFDAGVTLVAAAGNDNENACGHFPAAHTTVISVAASTTTDYRASFSNFGSCVDMFAPGQGITSAKRGGGSLLLSGTSMAAPHVSGAAALAVQNVDLAPLAVRNNLNGRATQNVISNANGSPNLLLFVLQSSNPPQPGGSTTTTTTTTASTITSSSTTTSGSTTSAAAASFLYRPQQALIVCAIFCVAMAFLTQ